MPPQLIPHSYLPPKMLRLPPPFKSGLILVRPEDLRYQVVISFRQRVGETLHRASSVMRGAGDSDNSVETVKLLVTAIGDLLTVYGIRSKQFTNAQATYMGMMAAKKVYEGQRKHHRSVLMAAATVHHQNRLTTLAYYRVRSELDDRLIRNMLDFCISPFVRVRRSAQSQLETIAKLYRGAWVLCYPMLFDALQPGTDPDIMKGALYVIRYNHVGLTRIAGDWRQLVQLTECLLNAHHENKASVQGLVAKAIDELVSKIEEPVSFDLHIRTERVDAAADNLSHIIRCKPDPKLISDLHQGLKDRTEIQDRQWDAFVQRVLAIATDPQLNWRYVLSACRFLLAVTRRDRPIDTRLARFFAENAQNPHPRIRDFGTVYVESTVISHEADPA